MNNIRCNRCGGFGHMARFCASADTRFWRKRRIFPYKTFVPHMRSIRSLRESVPAKPRQQRRQRSETASRTSRGWSRGRVQPLRSSRSLGERLREPDTRPESEKNRRGPKPDDKCRSCGEEGHWARDCPQQKKDDAAPAKEGDDAAPATMEDAPPVADRTPAAEKGTALSTLRKSPSETPPWRDG